MPIENERKYIIDLDCDKIEWLCEKYNGVLYNIKQAYINGGRIRLIQQHNHMPRFMFTWKIRRPDMSMIEIETDIPERDFDELWNMAGIVILKQRVKIFDNIVTWDIDFLKEYDINNEDGKNHYLTIAEVEMPEGLNEPPKIPSFVKDNLLYLVPRDKDNIWTNKNLSNPDKVKQMLADALKDKE